MNLTKILIKEIRSFKNCPQAQDYIIESLGVKDFILTLDLIFAKLSPETFYPYLLD